MEAVEECPGAVVGLGSLDLSLKDPFFILAILMGRDKNVYSEQS